MDFDQQEAKMILATGLYTKGKLTMGQAAELVGLSKRAFIEVMGTYGVSIFDLSAEELTREIANSTFSRSAYTTFHNTSL